MAKNSLTAMLREVYFLKNLGEDDLELIAERCVEMRYRAGEILCSEGGEADRFFILVEGFVEIWKDYRRAEPSLLAVHGPGHFFGEVALIDELPRSATIVAQRDVRVLQLERADFRALIEERTAIAIAVMAGISSLIRSSNEIYVEDLRTRNRELEAKNRELAEIHQEQLKGERLSTLGKFSSLILHDIRNPISALKGQIQLIELKSGDPGQVLVLAKSCLGEVSRLERLANEFLDYSRGEIRLDLAPTNASELLWRLEASIRDRLRSAGIELRREIACEESLLLDTERVLRALQNLADNARKAMPSGGVLSLEARRDGRELIICVRDTGEGMAPEILAKVFEPFYSASGRGGTGLGMLIVRNIVEAHGGKVRIESSRGLGTSVYLAFPLPAFVQ